MLHLASISRVCSCCKWPNGRWPVLCLWWIQPDENLFTGTDLCPPLSLVIKQHWPYSLLKYTISFLMHQHKNGLMWSSFWNVPVSCLHVVQKVNFLRGLMFTSISLLSFCWYIFLCWEFFFFDVQLDKLFFMIMVMIMIIIIIIIVRSY